MCYTEYLVIRYKDDKEEPEVHKEDKPEDNQEDFSIRGLNDYLTKHPYNKPKVKPEYKEETKEQKSVMLK